jgi:hypothetical protein
MGSQWHCRTTMGERTEKIKLKSWSSHKNKQRSRHYARKRFFLSAALMLVAVYVTAQQYDVLLKSGHVIDPKNGIDTVMGPCNCRRKDREACNKH